MVTKTIVYVNKFLMTVFGWGVVRLTIQTKDVEFNFWTVTRTSQEGLKGEIEQMLRPAPNERINCLTWVRQDF